jgi:hypothetical protein
VNGSLLVTRRGPGDPSWDTYAASPQGQVDRAAADRYEASTRHVLEGWKTADELGVIIRGINERCRSSNRPFPTAALSVCFTDERVSPK